MATTNTTTKVLREKANWRTLHFYQKRILSTNSLSLFVSAFYPTTATAPWTRWSKQRVAASRTS